MGAPPAAPPAPSAAPPDPAVLLRSPAYVKLLILAAVIGVPVSAIAYGFMKLVAVLQDAVYEDLPDALGFATAPSWWPIPMVAAGGLIVALAIQRLPGRGGHSPADGFQAAGAVPPANLPGIVLAALATLGSGAAVSYTHLTLPTNREV